MLVQLELERLIVAVVDGDRDIKAINVRCANIERGCHWTGTIGTLDTHAKVCEYTEVTCAYQSLGCRVKMMRKDIRKHEAEINTGHFNLMLGIVQSLTDEHRTLSKQYKTLSEQHKTLSEQHKTLSEQHKTLSKQNGTLLEKDEIISVQYQSLLEQHDTLLEKDKIRYEQYQSLLKQHKIQSEQIQSLSEQHKTLSVGEAFFFKLSGYTSKKYNKEKFHSTPFYTHPGGYKMCIRVDANGDCDGAGTHVSVYSKVLEGPYDDQLHWPFLGTVKCELLNQLEDDKHYSTKITCDATSDMLVGSSFGYHKFVPHSSLCHDSDTNTHYLLNDTLYFRVSVEVDNHKPWLVSTDKINVDVVGTINNTKSLKHEKRYIFKLSGYDVIKGANETFCSDSFYTSFEGYKICILTYPNGNDSGEGTHVSVYVKLLESSNDANLSWPFQGTVTFTLLNQLSDENHHSMMLEYEATNNYGYADYTFGYPEFIPHTSLSRDLVKNTEYLKNDSLYFRVSVKDNTHKPWLECTYN